MDSAKLGSMLRKLDALATNPGTPAEGVAATAKAAELREKYPNLLFSSKRAQIRHEVDTFAGFGQQNDEFPVDFDMNDLNNFLNKLFETSYAAHAPIYYTTVEQVKKQQKR